MRPNTQTSQVKRESLDEKGAWALNSHGCCGALARSFMKGMYYYPDKTKDFGFAGHMAGGFKYYKSNETGGAPEAMDRDYFLLPSF